MLVWGRLTDFSVTTLTFSVTYNPAKFLTVTGWVLGLGPAGDAGSWVSGLPRRLGLVSWRKLSCKVLVGGVALALGVRRLSPFGARRLLPYCSLS